MQQLYQTNEKAEFIMQINKKKMKNCIKIVDIYRHNFGNSTTITGSKYLRKQQITKFRNMQNIFKV
ncbi:unnamed protein product [Paramecium octaurelia]|uniref:Uncharacterized protein n=1 Tax=Paramecium octaurelia TaxID=43137 RepID=A0A8S1UA91_PAROT|nr:unnamed protein product [Paramecium octaurelia]